MSEETSGKYTLEIERVDNGYILRGTSDANGSPMVVVIGDDEKDELKVHETLLWIVMDYFNFSGSKHDAERLRVIREKREEARDGDGNQ